MNLNELTETGHFPKVYDRNRRIPDDVFDKVVKFIYSIPASVNVHSTHYIVASDMQSRSRVADAMGEGYEFNVPNSRERSAREEILVCEVVVAFDCAIADARSKS